MAKTYLTYLLPLMIMGVILYRRSGRSQKINLGRMWIRPAIFAVLAVATLVAAPVPGIVVLAAFVVAVLGGAGLGFLRASHLHLTIDPETGDIHSRATLVETVILLGLFAVRFGARAVFPQMGTPGHAGRGMTEITNGLLLFMVAMFIAQTVWIWSRTQPMKAEHAARKAIAGQAPAGQQPPMDPPPPG